VKNNKSSIQERRLDVFAGFAGGHGYNRVEHKYSMITELVIGKWYLTSKSLDPAQDGVEYC
jgi:hypothetical protein